MVDVTTHHVPWHTTGHHGRQRTFTQSSKLQDVLYEIRGPVHDHASRLEAEGHRILKLNIGNPAPFGFEAPDVIMRDIIQAWRTRRATRIPRASCRPGVPCSPATNSWRV